MRSVIKRLIDKMRGKDKVWKNNVENSKTVDTNSRMVDVLITLNKNYDIECELKKLKFELECMQSSPKESVAKIDCKIKNSLDDFRIVLTKLKDKDDTAKSEACLQDIRVLIAQRKTLL